jgi:acetyl-CoA carboxylase biotin carboxylase subunit
MHRALLELTIEGVDTSRDFHLRVMEDDEFRRGTIDIQWLERRLPSLLSQGPPDAGVRAAAIAAVLLAERDRTSPPVIPRTPINRRPPVEPWTIAARREGMR